MAFRYTAHADVLAGVSLTVPENSVVAVVGPSGCGKTTLLSLIAGLLKPTGGQIEWAPDAPGRKRHPLSMCFQRDTLLPWLTVEDNIGLYFRLSRTQVPKFEQKNRIAELIKMGGLQGAEKRYPYQLSGGMRRRTAFLAAVAPQPRTLLLDEPFSSLDEPTRVAIHQDIFDIVKKYGMSVILITHDLAEAISLSDNVVILTSTPTHVFAEHEVGFGDRRDMLKLRKDPEYLRLYGSLWEQLSAQMRRGSPTKAQIDPLPGPDQLGEQS